MQYNLDQPEFISIVNNESDNSNDNENNVSFLKCKKYKFNNSEYTIVTCDETLPENHPLGIFRSVVLQDKCVVSFSPPKSTTFDNFVLENPSKTNDIWLEEMIEGTMINLFWDNTMDNWNISTKNAVGGNTHFYKSAEPKSFKQMFDEALVESNLDLSLLNKYYCYSFVMQHPGNRIVVPVAKPTLFIIEMYKITHTERQCVVDVVPYTQVHSDPCWLNTFIRFPTIYRWEDYSEIIPRHIENSSYSFMGLVLKNMVTNVRCNISNPKYEEVWKLKGNQPKLQYQYLILRKMKKVGEYLKYYPEHTSKFTDFRLQLHIFTNQLFSYYVRCYIKKEKPLIEFSVQYRTHMFKIHQMFLSELKEDKKYVTLQVVIQYVNNLHESLQMSSLNYREK